MMRVECGLPALRPFDERLKSDVCWPIESSEEGADGLACIEDVLRRQRAAVIEPLKKERIIPRFSRLEADRTMAVPFPQREMFKRRIDAWPGQLEDGWSASGGENIEHK